MAERKVQSLLKFNATVQVAAPRMSSGIKKLAAQRRIQLINRNFRAGDIRGSIVVIGATDDREINRKISLLAKKQNILVNIVDDPELCSFIVPSIIKRGPLVVAISTSGRAPALAKALRLKLEKVITPRLGRLTEHLGELRKKAKHD